MTYLIQVLPSLLQGALVTLEVFFIVIILSIPLGALLAFMMQVKFKPLEWLITLYIWVMRAPIVVTIDFLLLCLAQCRGNYGSYASGYISPYSELRSLFC